ncbi:hypothetical protein BT96DRAFT_1010138 [Gymnopus androsaceus JB14]|uniref:Uncharacterized protein n=1 Tax=Gymnopus androsaceus JB14 TaxID=1447944 RepID=A0A6A4GBC4_9AGAR|nr:hypothetical protein BT96DRAFT_1010138 [Gymnopus androsaceus JB14]
MAMEMHSQTETLTVLDMPLLRIPNMDKSMSPKTIARIHSGKSLISAFQRCLAQLGLMKEQAITDLLEHLQHSALHQICTCIVIQLVMVGKLKETVKQPEPAASRKPTKAKNQPEIRESAPKPQERSASRKKGKGKGPG